MLTIGLLVLVTQILNVYFLYLQSKFLLHEMPGAVAHRPEEEHPGSSFISPYRLRKSRRENSLLPLAGSKH